MLGDELRKQRLAVRLSQEELAFRARVSRNYISLLELGAKSPTVATLIKVCKVLRIKPSVLIARVERRQKASK